MFLFCATALSIDRLDPYEAYPDECRSFFVPKKNHKTKLINFPENGTICFHGSFIFGSDSKFYVEAAFQKYNKSNEKWYWDYVDQKESPLAVLGQYDEAKYDFLDPVAKVTCKVSKCKIQVLEVDASYDVTNYTESVNYITENHYVRRSFINSKKNGTQELYVLRTLNKVNDSYYEKHYEYATAFFAFPEPRHMTYSRDSGVRIWYSQNQKYINQKKNKGTIGSPKTSEIRVDADLSEINQDFNLSCNLTWAKNDEEEEEDRDALDETEDPNESYFPEVSGQFSTEGGVYTVDSFSYYGRGEDPAVSKLPGWAIALIVIGCVLLAATIIVVIIIVLKKKKE